MSMWDAIEGTQAEGIPNLSSHDFGDVLFLWLGGTYATDAEAINRLEDGWGSTLSNADKDHLTDMETVYNGKNNLGKLEYVGRIQALANQLQDNVVTQAEARTMAEI